MQSFHAVVVRFNAYWRSIGGLFYPPEIELSEQGDTSHPEPAFGAVRTSHYGHYRGFEKLRLENAKVWKEKYIHQQSTSCL